MKYKVLYHCHTVFQRGLVAIIEKRTMNAGAWEMKNLLRDCGLKKARLYKRANLAPGQ